GTVAVAYRGGRVVYCTYVDRLNLAQFERGVAQTIGTMPERQPALPLELDAAIRDHIAGRRRFTEVDLSWLPPFQRRVLEKTAEIPHGEVRPYGWVAREIGSPGATRAVGTALGHNPIPLLIPCHRVVRSDGSLGEYSGGGPSMKVRVLEMEGVAVEDLLSAARRGERLRGCRSTHVVCYPSCRTGRTIQPENAALFVSLAQAEATGYRPCQWCRPA
ncbi:MAG: methylated-DNA--[protein]-cysteine S-methyltransferase, partial [Dehalococcoidia bacterium]